MRLSTVLIEFCWIYLLCCKDLFDVMIQRYDRRQLFSLQRSATFIPDLLCTFKEVGILRYRSKRGGHSARAKILVGIWNNNESSRHDEYDIDLHSIVVDSDTNNDIKSYNRGSSDGLQIPIVKTRTNYRPVHRSRTRQLTRIAVDKKADKIVLFS